MKFFLNLFKKNYIKFFLVIFFVLGFSSVANAIDGTINSTYYTAQVCENVACTETSTSTVNFGYFTNNPSRNVVIEDTELSGYIWGESFGWAVLNCKDTTSGCSATNGNFKVANDGNGNLSGYAWGDASGWINFGPFTNTSTSSVSISGDGEFGGYAWAQNYGWIKFDCSNTSFCVKTSWAPKTNRTVSGFSAKAALRNKGLLTPPVFFPIVPPEFIPTLPSLPEFPSLPTVPSIDSSVDEYTNPFNSKEDNNPGLPSRSEDVVSFFDFVFNKAYDSLSPVIRAILFVKIKVTNFLTNEVGAFAAKIAPITGLVFGTMVSILPELFITPLTLAERALIPSRFTRFLSVLFGKRYRREDHDDNIYHPGKVHILGPAHDTHVGFEMLAKIVFFIGFIVTSMVFWVYPTTQNTIVFVLYLIIFILNVSIHRPKR